MDEDMRRELSRRPGYGDVPATDPGLAQRTEDDATGRGARPLVEHVTENEKLRIAYESLRRELAQVKIRFDEVTHELIVAKQQRDNIAQDAEVAIARANAAEERHEAVANALCPQCGRSQQPDGDCYGCAVDRLQEEIAKLKGMGLLHPQPDAVVEIVKQIEGEGMGYYRDRVITDLRARLAQAQATIKRLQKDLAYTSEDRDRLFKLAHERGVKLDRIDRGPR